MLDNDIVDTAPITPRSPAVARMIDLKLLNPNMTTREIAKIVDRDHSCVVKALKRYKVDATRTEEYKKHRADIFAAVQHRILSKIAVKDIQKASLKDKSIAVSILYDKERLERGQATSITAFADLLGLLDRQEREKAKQQLNKNDDEDFNERDFNERDRIFDAPSPQQIVDSSPDLPEST